MPKFFAVPWLVQIQEKRQMSATQSKFRMMHTMVRVRDLEKSLKIYTELLGMSLLRREDFPAGNFTLAFVGYGPESTEAVVELTHNWDQAEPYAIGTGYGHIALGVRDIHGICSELEKQGATIPRKPGPMMHGKTHIAFVEDPDGYKIELIDLDTAG
jgi:lactoylglutathione lyase